MTKRRRKKKKLRLPVVLSIFLLIILAPIFIERATANNSLFHFFFGKPTWEGVVIDPGHGGDEPGAVAVYKGERILEKNLNLDIAKRVAQSLKEQGVPVILTRDDDSNLGFVERAQIANKKGAALFVSIHLNSNMASAPRGIECYYPRGTNSSGMTPAQVIGSYLSELGTPYRGELPGKYTVLMSNNSPATLLELGFMSNPHDMELLMNPEFRQKLAEKVAEGIVAYSGQAFPSQ